MNYEIHEAANAFPMLSGEELKELAQDIKENGQQMPILLFGEKIIDGRNRAVACRIAGIEPKYTTVHCEDPYLYVWSLNAKRRHLNSQEQKALIWRKLHGQSQAMVYERERIKEEADKKRSEKQKGIPKSEISERACTDCTHTLPKSQHKPTREAEAKAADVNKGAMARAAALENADPDLAEKVASGEVIYAKASCIVKKKKHEDSIQKQKDDIECCKIELPKGLYEVIAIDPPWNYGRKYDPNGSRVANPYPEMAQDELLKLEIPAANDSVLFLWTTHKFIFDAKELLEKWGFEYKATLVWDKEMIGMGNWLRMQCEFCLVGIKGRPMWNNTTWRDIIREKRREHSRKPEIFYKMVEEITIGRKLEYFSRSAREGWEVFGNDTSKF